MRRLLRRKRPGRKHLEVDGAGVFVVCAPEHAKRPAARRRDILNARPTLKSNHRLGLAVRPALDNEIQCPVLVHPGNLVLRPAHPRAATPAHLSGNPHSNPAPGLPKPPPPTPPPSFLTTPAVH